MSWPHLNVALCGWIGVTLLSLSLEKEGELHLVHMCGSHQVTSQAGWNGCNLGLI